METDNNTVFSDLRKELLHHRYLLKNEYGQVKETPEQMWQRVAETVAQAEKLYGLTEAEIKAQAEEFYQIMAGGYFLPNSPTIINAGRKNGMLSACYVLPIPDSIEGIFDSIKYTALIQKSGGGTGFSFDALRPTGDLVVSSGGSSSGPIIFWQVFSETTHAIQQGAHRRGANMGMMSLEHPDILNFIHAKKDPSKFSNFNISVKVSDDFMKSLHQALDTPHIVTNPRTGQGYFIPKSIEAANYTLQDLIPAHTSEVVCYSKKEIWNMIVTNAHANGEPGLCFIDRVNKANPTPQLGMIQATNPCGEQPLLDFEACNLGSLNLTRFVLPEDKEIDWDSLKTTIQTAVRFLDDVIDVNYYPLPQIEEITLGNRKIGLGVMGFADALILLGIRYDSKPAVTLAGELSRFIQECAHQASEQLAEDALHNRRPPGLGWSDIYPFLLHFLFLSYYHFVFGLTT